MRTIETKVYAFSELSDDAKEQALQGLYDINVDHEWWDSTYEDAERAGLKLSSFDLDRYREAKGDFIECAEECAAKTIAEHGESCETYQTARQYQTDRDALVDKFSDGVDTQRVAEDSEYEFDRECDDLDAEFLRSILEDYSIILQHEYEYLTGEEAILATIEANDYEFTADGKLA